MNKLLNKIKNIGIFKLILIIYIFYNLYLLLIRNLPVVVLENTTLFLNLNNFIVNEEHIKLIFAINHARFDTNIKKIHINLDNLSQSNNQFNSSFPILDEIKRIN